MIGVPFDTLCDLRGTEPEHMEKATFAVTMKSPSNRHLEMPF